MIFLEPPPSLIFFPSFFNQIRQSPQLIENKTGQNETLSKSSLSLRKLVQFTRRREGKGREGRKKERKVKKVFFICIIHSFIHLIFLLFPCLPFFGIVVDFTSSPSLRAKKERKGKRRKEKCKEKKRKT